VVAEAGIDAAGHAAVEHRTPPGATVARGWLRRGVPQVQLYQVRGHSPAHRRVPQGGIVKAAAENPIRGTGRCRESRLGEELMMFHLFFRKKNPACSRDRTLVGSPGLPGRGGVGRTRDCGRLQIH